MSRQVSVRLTPGEYRRLFAVARRLGGHQDDATVAGLVRRMIKALLTCDSNVIMAAAIEMRDAVDKFERRADQLDLGLARRQQRHEEGPETETSRLTGGADARPA